MPDKIRVIIVEDEKLGRDIIKNYLKDNDRVELAAECTNGFEGIKEISEQKPDIVFLDIQMPKINGFEMLELIDNPPVIIFTTAFDQYAIKAFEVNATDYLLKPFTKERFEEALNKAVKQLSNKNDNETKIKGLIDTVEEQGEYLDRVVVKSNQKISIIDVNKLTYLEAQDDYVMLYTNDAHHLKQKTMKYFETHLDPKDFIRIHRSYIVKISQIKQIELVEKETYKVTLHNGVKLPVSRNGYAKLKEILN